MAAWRAVAVGALAVVAAACSELRGTSIDLRVAPLVWGGEQKLLASDAAELDQFGCSVSLANDGAADRAVVGAFGESDGRGAAYVFVRSADGWVEEQKLVASDGAEPDKFGASVSLGADAVSKLAGEVYVKTGANPIPGLWAAPA